MCVCLYVLGFEVNIFACVRMDIVYVCLCTGNYMRLLNVACKYISGCNCVRFLLSSWDSMFVKDAVKELGI